MGLFGRSRNERGQARATSLGVAAAAAFVPAQGAEGYSTAQLQANAQRIYREDGARLEAENAFHRRTTPGLILIALLCIAWAWWASSNQVKHVVAVPMDKIGHSLGSIDLDTIQPSDKALTEAILRGVIDDCFSTTTDARAASKVYARCFSFILANSNASRSVLGYEKVNSSITRVSGGEIRTRRSLAYTSSVDFNSLQPLSPDTYEIVFTRTDTPLAADSSPTNKTFKATLHYSFFPPTDPINPKGLYIDRFDLTDFVAPGVDQDGRSK